MTGISTDPSPTGRVRQRLARFHPIKPQRELMASSKRPTTAVLVIHGMGQQQRYGTLLSLARRLCRCVGGSLTAVPDVDQPDKLARGLRDSRGCDQMAFLPVSCLQH